MLRSRPSVLPVLLALVAAPATAADSAWEPVGSGDGVSVAWRPVAGRAIKEIRATGIVAHPAARLLAVLGDVEHYPEFMPPTARTRVLKREGATGWFYVEVNPAWISRRDYCVRSTAARLPDGTLEDSWVQTDELCPPPPRGVLRLAHTEGHWLLRPLDERHTVVEYQAVTDPGGSLPAWIANRATAHHMRHLFRSLTETAANPNYGRCPPNAFGCL